MTDVRPMTTDETTVALGAAAQETGLVKIHNQEMMLMAVQHPRSHDRVLQDLRAQVDSYPAFARAAMYCKPVGKDKNGKQTYARDLSIRAAEALCSAWGNCSAGVQITAETNDYVDLVATFVDLEKCIQLILPARVSKSYKSHYGGVKRIADDRFVNVILKAKTSILLRDVILRSIPPGPKEELREMVQTAMTKLLTPEETAKIVSYFVGINVTLEQLEKRLDSKQAAWNHEDRLLLRGIMQALKDGETTVDEVFNDDAGQPVQRKRAVTEDAEPALPPPAPTTQPEPGPTDETPATSTVSETGTLIDEIMELTDGDAKQKRDTIGIILINNFHKSADAIKQHKDIRDFLLLSCSIKELEFVKLELEGNIDG